MAQITRKDWIRYCMMALLEERSEEMVLPHDPSNAFYLMTIWQYLEEDIQRLTDSMKESMLEIALLKFKSELGGIRRPFQRDEKEEVCQMIREHACRGVYGYQTDIEDAFIEGKPYVEGVDPPYVNLHNLSLIYMKRILHLFSKTSG